MALNDVYIASKTDVNEEALPAIHMLCLKYGARVTIPCNSSDSAFQHDQEEAKRHGLRLTRYPRWYLGDDDSTGQGMDRLTFEALNRHELLAAFDKLKAEVPT